VKTRKWNLVSRKWWDKNCRENKTRLNKILRRYRRGKVTKEEYLKKKRTHKEICRTKEEEHRRKEQTELMKITDIDKVWKYIRKESGKQRVDENIGEEE